MRELKIINDAPTDPKWFVLQSLSQPDNQIVLYLTLGGAGLGGALKPAEKFHVNVTTTH